MKLADWFTRSRFPLRPPVMTAPPRPPLPDPPPDLIAESRQRERAGMDAIAASCRDGRRYTWLSAGTLPPPRQPDATVFGGYRPSGVQPGDTDGPRRECGACGVSWHGKAVCWHCESAGAVT